MCHSFSLVLLVLLFYLIVRGIKPEVLQKSNYFISAVQCLLSFVFVNLSEKDIKPLSHNLLSIKLHTPH